MGDLNERPRGYLHPSLEEQRSKEWPVRGQHSNPAPTVSDLWDFVKASSLFLLPGDIHLERGQHSSLTVKKVKKTKEVCWLRYNWSCKALSQSSCYCYLVTVSSSWEGEYQVSQCKSLNWNVIGACYQPFVTVRSHAWDITRIIVFEHWLIFKTL